jgi:hypothetical protein
MHDVAENLRQFKIEREASEQAETPELNEMKKIQQATRIYHEEEMQALEKAEETRASV